MTSLRPVDAVVRRWPEQQRLTVLLLLLLASVVVHTDCCTSCTQPTLGRDELLAANDMLRQACAAPMAQAYCLNGGQCFNFTVAEYTLPACLCATGFMGERCENKYPEQAYPNLLSVHAYTTNDRSDPGSGLVDAYPPVVFVHLSSFAPDPARNNTSNDDDRRNGSEPITKKTTMTMTTMSPNTFPDFSGSSQQTSGSGPKFRGWCAIVAGMCAAGLALLFR